MDSITATSTIRSVSKKSKLTVQIPNKNINRGDYTNLLEEEWQENVPSRDLRFIKLKIKKNKQKLIKKSQLGPGESLKDWEQQALQETLSIDLRFLNYQGLLAEPFY